MANNPKILLIGNIKEENSKSMLIYSQYLQKNLNNFEVIIPSTKIKTAIYKNLIYPLKLLRIRYSKKYDIYHILDHSYGNLAYFLPRNKTVITCHDLIQLKIKIGNWKSRLSFRFYVSGLKIAKKVIADSKSTKEDLIKELGVSSSKIEIIPPLSIDKNVFRKLDKESIKKKYNLSNNFVLLSVGSYKYKNTLLILKALDRLKKEFLNLKLIKIGIFTEEELKFIKEKNLKGLIVEKENLSEKEIIEMYNLADIFVFPSLYEGFGIPPLEAMACGIPVITSSVASLPEVVGNAGILINPNFVSELINAIKKIKNNIKLRSKLIKKGYKNLDRFNQEKIIKKLNKVYHFIYKNNF